jgi:hypothetical protein
MNHPSTATLNQTSASHVILREEALPELVLSRIGGRYSEVLIGREKLEKRNYVDTAEDPLSMTREAKSRCQETIRYLSRLKEVGVSLPAMKVSLDIRQSRPCIVITAEKIKAPHNLIQVAQAAPQEKVTIITGVFTEMMKIVGTQNGARPVGYDSGFDNFVSVGGRCFLVDVFPPRMGYKTLPDRSTEVLPLAERLINYGERENLSPERQAQMQRYYYTPEGTIEHLITWALSSAFATDSEMTWERAKETPLAQEIIATARSVLLAAGNAQLVTHLDEYLTSQRGLQELSYRFMRTPVRLKTALAQWEAVCRLF